MLAEASGYLLKPADYMFLCRQKQSKPGLRVDPVQPFLPKQKIKK